MGILNPLHLFIYSTLPMKIGSEQRLAKCQRKLSVVLILSFKTLNLSQRKFLCVYIISRQAIKSQKPILACPRPRLGPCLDIFVSRVQSFLVLLMHLVWRILVVVSGGSSRCTWGRLITAPVRYLLPALLAVVYIIMNTSVLLLW